MNNQIAEKIKIRTENPKRRRDRLIDLWARLPLVLRIFAAGTLAVTILAVAIGYWRMRDNQDFVLKPENPRLTMEVVAVVNGYERRVTDGDKLQLLVRADKETTFADKRHELENVYVESYEAHASAPNRISAAKAIYQPNTVSPENFTINFFGNVNFETREGIKVQTEQISYDKQQETAETTAAVNFVRDNISGSAVGAKLNVKEKHLTLLNQVEINVLPNGNGAKNSLTDFGSSTVKINGARANFDQELDQLEIEQNVNILVTPQDAQIAPTTIRADKAVYRKDLQKLDLSGNAEIVSASDNLLTPTAANLNKTISRSPSVPATIRADAISYEQGNGKIYLLGKASVEQSGELMNGERIVADLSREKKLQNVVTVGHAFLRTISIERTTEVNAAEMNFKFAPNQQIQFAKASGAVKVRSVSGANVIDLNEPATLDLTFKIVAEKSFLEKMTTGGNSNVKLTTINSPDYSDVQMSAPISIEVLFAAQNDRSVLRQMTTNGRTTILMSAPAAQIHNPSATSKKIVADGVKLWWSAAGQDLDRAEAVGNAELYIFPLQAAPNLDKNSLFAARFDCKFFERGNLAETFVASGTAKAVLEPTVPSEERGVRNLSADQMTTNFDRASQTVESFRAIGNAKFSELDRNGVANTFNYTARDGIVRLRGGEPTVWDQSARLKAIEIDWKTLAKTSSLRGKVATTYYSQAQTGGATPFAKVNSPVFITSNSAEFNHAAGAAVYIGEAKAWQDSNFIRADKLTLQRDTKSMFGEGRVNSALYNAKRSENGKQTVVPVFATSDRMSYSDNQKLLRYENQVEIKQGTDRIESGIAEVYLNIGNEVAKTVAQTNVVVTQPGRRASGDWAQYTTADETIVLRGNPARVEDAAQGTSNGRQLTVYLRENRVEGQGGAVQGAPGRIRSTHKITKQ